MMDILKIILGGLLALLGGFFATWYQAKNARKIRMEEVIAERKVTANAEAYTKMKEIVSILAQGSFKNVLRIFMENERWFFDNRIFLPGSFPNYWLSVRNQIAMAIKIEEQSPERTNELSLVKGSLIRTANKAIDEIYPEMGIDRIEVMTTQ